MAAVDDHVRAAVHARPEDGAREDDGAGADGRGGGDGRARVSDHGRGNTGGREQAAERPPRGHRRVPDTDQRAVACAATHCLDGGAVVTENRHAQHSVARERRVRVGEADQGEAGTFPEQVGDRAPVGARAHDHHAHRAGSVWARHREASNCRW